jgi:hypothetical protein
MRIELVLAHGLEGTGDEADRGATSELIEGLYQFELDRLARQVLDELGPLAFSLYVPGSPTPGETRLDQLLRDNCVHQALMRARDSADSDAQARASRIWDRLHAPLELPPTESETLRLELPPSDLIVPGEMFTGRVVDDRLVGGGEQSRRVIEDGLLVESAGQTVHVGRDGRFVLRAPEQAGSYVVEVRHREKTSPPPIDGVFATAAPAASAAATVASPLAPRMVLPDQPLIVRGRLHGGGVGLATRGRASRPGRTR